MIAFAKDIKADIQILNEMMRKKKDQLKFYQKLDEMIKFHSIVKQLS